jgi:hypothetical protein
MCVSVKIMELSGRRGLRHRLTSGRDHISCNQEVAKKIHHTPSKHLHLRPLFKNRNKAANSQPCARGPRENLTSSLAHHNSNRSKDADMATISYLTLNEAANSSTSSSEPRRPSHGCPSFPGTARTLAMMMSQNRRLEETLVCLK